MTMAMAMIVASNKHWHTIKLPNGSTVKACGLKAAQTIINQVNSLLQEFQNNVSNNFQQSKLQQTQYEGMDLFGRPEIPVPDHDSKISTGQGSGLQQISEASPERVGKSEDSIRKVTGSRDANLTTREEFGITESQDSGGNRQAQRTRLSDFTASSENSLTRVGGGTKGSGISSEELGKQIIEGIHQFTREATEITREATENTKGAIAFAGETLGVAREAIAFSDKTLGIAREAIAFSDKTLGIAREAVDLNDRVIDIAQQTIGVARESIDVAKWGIGSACGRVFDGTGTAEQCHEGAVLPGIGFTGANVIDVTGTPVIDLLTPTE